MEKQPTTEELIAELYLTEGRAEIINGKIVQLELLRANVASACGSIMFLLHEFCKADKHNRGRTYTSGLAYLVDLPHRKSISPIVSYYTGPSAGMKFPRGAPDLAVEIRCCNEYGPEAEQYFLAKRYDYFAVGSKVVWDVDLMGEDVVRVYRSTAPDVPTIYRRGELAEAEPAVPGWKMPVDEIFE